MWQSESTGAYKPAHWQSSLIRHLHVAHPRGSLAQADCQTHWQSCALPQRQYWKSGCSQRQRTQRYSAGCVVLNDPPCNTRGGDQVHRPRGAGYNTSHVDAAAQLHSCQAHWQFHIAETRGTSTRRPRVRLEVAKHLGKVHTYIWCTMRHTKVLLRRQRRSGRRQKSPGWVQAQTGSRWLIQVPTCHDQG